MVHRMTRVSHWNRRTDQVDMTGVKEQHLMVGEVVVNQLVVATNNNIMMTSLSITSSMM